MAQTVPSEIPIVKQQSCINRGVSLKYTFNVYADVLFVH